MQCPSLPRLFLAPQAQLHCWGTVTCLLACCTTCLADLISTTHAFDEVLGGLREQCIPVTRRSHAGWHMPVRWGQSRGVPAHAAHLHGQEAGHQSHQRGEKRGHGAGAQRPGVRQSHLRALCSGVCQVVVLLQAAQVACIERSSAAMLLQCRPASSGCLSLLRTRLPRGVSYMCCLSLAALPSGA